jgi:Ser/Thr protein kinase RdoA (MazF antagonist)
MTHGDYVPANTLFHEERLSAILDFDMAQPDARAIDMATGLEFSLRLWERADPLPFAAAFWQGYRRWVQPTAAEIAAIPTLIRLRDAVSAIWWLGRGLAQGTVEGGLARLRDQQITKAWLHEHRERLAALLAS